MPKIASQKTFLAISPPPGFIGIFEDRLFSGFMGLLVLPRKIDISADHLFFKWVGVQFLFWASHFSLGKIGIYEVHPPF